LRALARASRFDHGGAKAEATIVARNGQCPQQKRGSPGPASTGHSAMLRQADLRRVAASASRARDAPRAQAFAGLEKARRPEAIVEQPFRAPNVRRRFIADNETRAPRSPTTAGAGRPERREGSFQRSSLPPAEDKRPSRLARIKQRWRAGREKTVC